MQAELNSPKHSRETLLEFKQDWTRLQDSRGRATASATSKQDLPLASALASSIPSLAPTPAFPTTLANTNFLTSEEVTDGAGGD